MSGKERQAEPGLARPLKPPGPIASRQAWRGISGGLSAPANSPPGQWAALRQSAAAAARRSAAPKVAGRAGRPEA
ncbi:hypothetical protein VTN96DRAFT_3801 [Rasamsonia emersonii]